jgi:hypothetical protein
VLLYLLRFVLDPQETVAGMRRVVLNAAPLPAAPAPERRPGARFDLHGLILLAAGLTGLLLGVSRGASAGWTAPAALVPLAVGVTLTVGYVAWAARREQPTLDLSLPATEPPVSEPPDLAGASKKARLAWWYKQDPDYGNRTAVAAAAKRLAPKVDLSEGTARAYLAQILAELPKVGEAS